MAGFPLQVRVTGPHGFSVAAADVLPLGAGAYRAALLFQAFGQHRIRVLLDGTAVAEGDFCVDVSAGGSLAVSKAAGDWSGLVVPEEGGAATEHGVTVECWAAFDALDVGASLVMKGLPEVR
jgi:hypothetical protein